MAKDKVTVPTIGISNQRSGTAFGGVIFSSDVSVGYNGEPTKLNINAALDTKMSGSRDFRINKNDLNLASPVSIKIGGVSMFYNMFLSSYNINTGVGEKTLNLTYTDGSVLLNRIYVGLIHQHFQVDKGKHYVPNVVGFDVNCPTLEVVNVDGTDMPVCSSEGSTLYKNIKTYRLLASPTGIPGKPYKVFPQSKRNLWQGGWMVLGREEFTEVNCDMSDVSYGFEDLISAIQDRKNGFNIKVDRKRYTMTSDSNLLLRSYTGTLKDVIQSWANDLKISYFWDFTQKSPTIVLSNKADKSVESLLKKCVSNIESLDKSGDGSDFAGRTGIVINSKSESVTLDGTVSQAFSSNFNIGPRAKNTTKRKTSEISFTCQTIEDIAASTFISGRKPRDVKICAGLGKYSKDLRDIWNMRKAIAIHTDPEYGLDGAIGYYNASGFSDIIPVNYGENNGKASLDKIVGHLGLTQIFSSQAGKGNSNTNPLDQQNWEDDYKIFIGVYDERLKTVSSGVEEELAGGYLGKHYVFGAPKSETFEGTSSYKLHETSETRPNSTYYSLNQHFKTPMAKFAKKVEDLRINSAANADYIYKNLLNEQIREQRFDIVNECKKKNRDKSLYRDSFRSGLYHFEREAPWATYQEDVDNLLNPHELKVRVWADGSSAGHTAYNDEVERVKLSLLRAYTPNNYECPVITQFIQDLGGAKAFSKMSSMMALGEATDKRVVVCVIKGEGKEGSMNMSGVPGDKGTTTIGDLEVKVAFKTRDSTTSLSTSGGERNPLEEINALRSLCDRTSAVTPDAVQEHKTVCERDFVEELCSSVNFGQKDKSCGEAEAEKDSLYSLELEPDIRSGGVHGIYSDCISLQRTNRKVVVAAVNNQKIVQLDPELESGTGKSYTVTDDWDKIREEWLYSDTRDPRKVTDNPNVNIIYPSENRHSAMLIYNRDLTVTDLGVRKVYDPINGNRIQIDPRASSVSYQLKDISQDITSLVNDERKQEIRRGEIPQTIVADVDNISKSDGTLRYRELQTLTAQAYHERLRGNISDIQVVEPRKSYTFKIYIDSGSTLVDEGGAEVTYMEKLVSLLKPENGLDSLSISMDEGGLSVSVSLSNRASADVALQEIFNKVGPLAREVKDKYSTQRSNNA